MLTASIGGGRVVMHATSSLQVGDTNPGALIICSGADAAKVSRPGFEPPTTKHAPAALPLNQRRCTASPLLVAY